MKRSKIKKPQPKERFKFSTSQLSAIAVALIVFVVGYMVINGRATGFFAGVDVESGTTSGNAQVVNDSGAYGGKAVLFQAPTSTTPPPSSGGGSGSYPAAGTVGYKTSNCSGGTLIISSSTTLITAVAAAKAKGTPLPDLVWDSAGYLDVRGTGGTLNCVWVKGGLTSNVSGTLKITNSIIEGGNVSWLIMGIYSGGLDIEDSTIRWKSGVGAETYNPGSTGSPVITDASGHSPANVKIIRNDISGNGDGLGVTGNNWIITDNWIHNLSLANGNHNDGIQIYGGTGLNISRNRIEVSNSPCNFSSSDPTSGRDSPACLPNSAIFTQGSGIGSLIVDNNFFNGGAYQLYLENGTAAVTNNVFGPYKAFGNASTQGASISAWSNNCSGDAAGSKYSPCQAVNK